MIRVALGALGGALLLHQLPELPAWPWALPGVALGLGAAWRRWPVAAALGLGFAWAVAMATLRAPAALPATATAGELAVEGVVASLVERQGERARFVFRIERLQLPDGQVLDGGWRARLSWYRAPDGLAPDQRWRLTVKLRPAHGYANPGGFDFEGWLFRRGIGQTGYVRPAGGVLLQERARAYPVARWRQQISSRLAGLLGPGPAAGVLRALSVGDRSGISPEQWTQFRRTGTGHLMAISGLHIGLVAGAVGGLVGLLWRRCWRLCRRWPALLAGGMAGWIAALAYALLAGFSLPTQRALLMLSVGLVLLLGRRQLLPAPLLALALLTVLAWDPLAVGDPGFWLSFAAVGIILLVVRGQRRRGWHNWLGIQLGLTLGLAPALLAHGLPVPLTGLPANLVAVPLFSLVVVPAALFGSLMHLTGLDGTGLVLRLAAAVLEWTLPLLAWAARPDELLLQLPAPGAAVLGLAALGVAVLLLPRGMPGRWLGLMLLLPLGFGQTARHGLGAGDFRLTVLDVGQGLSTVIETRDRVLVFDTGPAFRGGFDTGRAVVAPFLRQQGWRRIDRLILSHADGDHAGGTAGLLDELAARQVASGEPDEFTAIAVTPCADGQRWDWQGVAFAVLHPGPGDARSGNDASCVLRVSNAAGAVLLTGDVETESEGRLVAAHRAQLPVAVVVAPHHGSRTSSTPALVAATAPEHVVYAAGFRNRYGFPAPDVVARWEAAGASGVNTADSGAVSFVFRRDGRLVGPMRYRETERRYWHHRDAN